MVGFWERLHESQLISDKKFYSLIKTEYREKDQERFINRQLVETRQITKNVARILKNHLTETNIMTVRANLTHDFRIKYDIYKNRNVNDYHHAHDAYICCVIGEYIKLRFPKLESKYIYGEFIKCSKDKTLLSSKDGFVLNSMNNISADENGEVIWDPREIYKIKNASIIRTVLLRKNWKKNLEHFIK